MNRSPAALLTLAALGSSALAQTVEFRIVERTGQTQVLPGGDTVLDFAVQARVTGGPPGSALGGFYFDVVLAGEPDTSGTLTRGLISNPDHTYASAFAANNAVGSGGLAAQYTYLANIVPVFNGLINLGAGTFTDTSGNQEIGLITGSSLGAPLLGTPGLDPLGEGNPATWSGYGSGATPTPGDTAPLDPAVGAAYFGLGQFIDVYRFRYTVTDPTGRQLHATLERVGAQTFAGLLAGNNSWSTQTDTLATSQISTTGLTIDIGTPGACCDAATGHCTLVFESACTAGAFTDGGVCAPNPCPAPLGQCCSTSGGGCTTTTLDDCPPANSWTLTCCNASTGACTTTIQPGCAPGNAWLAAAACSPNPCPVPPSGSCCGIATGACTTTARPDCPSGSIWAGGGACSPNPCVQPLGACCDHAATTCTTTTEADCAPGLTWRISIACTSAACPLPRGTCCDAGTGSCALQTQPACAGGAHTWSLGGSCSPNPCVASGVCCNFITGVCWFVPLSGCGSGSHSWNLGGACDPNPCPPTGACCNVQTGACVRRTRAACQVWIESAGGFGWMWIQSATCSPTPCPHPEPGLCCNTYTGACTLLLQQDCGINAHAWSAAGTSCTPNPCEPPGACCLTTGAGTICRRKLVADCAAVSGTWSAGACSPNPCTPSLAVLVPAPPPRACAADFDQSGSLDIADILSFTSAWLSTDPRADFDRSGAINAHDVFAYLASWFAGCHPD